MNRRAYFLACLNVYLLRAGPYEPRVKIVEVQSKAWHLPEEAIPEDPAYAALEFFGYYSTPMYPDVEKLKPQWLAEWEERSE